MKNITELRSDLMDNYVKMKDKQMELKEGKELANTAGKVLTSLKIELEYNAMMGIKTPIPFLQVEK
jgi:hypothetical protein